MTEPHEIHKPLHYPEIGERESYVIYHEELESLVKNYPTIKRARFWMTFGQEYLTSPARDSEYRHGPNRSDHLQRRGDRADSVPEGRAARSQVAGCELSRPDFDRLPHPGYQGRQKERTYYIYNNCDHEKAFQETGTQAVSFTRASRRRWALRCGPRALARCGRVQRRGVRSRSVPGELGPQGLPWVERFDIDLKV